MERLETFIKKVIELMGFNDYKVEIKPGEKRGLIFIYENDAIIRENLPSIVEGVNHLLHIVAGKLGEEPVFFDVNNYRAERERLIAELSRAAAKKAVLTKEKITLPAMNSYERRIVHVELSVHPEVTTESEGTGKERCVVVKPIN